MNLYGYNTAIYKDVLICKYTNSIPLVLLAKFHSYFNELGTKIYCVKY